MSDKTTKKAPEGPRDLRKEYDFSKGIRGKYAKRYAQGSNVVVLDPDVAEAFPTAQKVNEALRGVARKKSASG
jgi:hypothetical protein